MRHSVSSRLREEEKGRSFGWRLAWRPQGAATDRSVSGGVCVEGAAGQHGSAAPTDLDWYSLVTTST